jgi:hypothetical protein
MTTLKTHLRLKISFFYQVCENSLAKRWQTSIFEALHAQTTGIGLVFRQP